MKSCTQKVVVDTSSFLGKPSPEPVLGTGYVAEQSTTGRSEECSEVGETSSIEGAA